MEIITEQQNAPRILTLDVLCDTDLPTAEQIANMSVKGVVLVFNETAGLSAEDEARIAAWISDLPVPSATVVTPEKKRTTFARECHFVFHDENAATEHLNRITENRPFAVIHAITAAFAAQRKRSIEAALLEETRLFAGLARRKHQQDAP